MTTHNVNNYFTDIYLVNCDENIQEWLCIKKQCISLKIHVTRFGAKSINDRSIRLDYAILKNDNKKTKISKIQDYATILTYLKLYKDIVAYGGGEKFLILEDNIKFHPNFNELFEQQICLLPTDWNMWYLGSTENKTNNTKTIDGLPFTYANKTLGLFAHAVKKSFIRDQLIPTLEKRIYRVDEAIANDLQETQQGIYVSCTHLCYL